jgi:hypothetical protein
VHESETLKERGLWDNPEQDSLVRYLKTSKREKVVERKTRYETFVHQLI